MKRPLEHGATVAEELPSPRFVIRRRGTAAFLSAFLLLSTGNQQPGVRVNDALAPGEDVQQWAVSPDGTRVFYLVTQPGGGRRIFSAPTDGSQGALALTDPLATGQPLTVMRLGPDGQRIVYSTDADTPGQIELYGVPTDGSQPPVKLSAPLIAAGDVLDFRFVPDGSKVVYLADALQDNVQLPFSVPADGSSPAVQLGSERVFGAFQLTPDGATLVFRNTELYSVPVDGSAPPVELSTYPGNGFSVEEQIVSPDGLRVVYRAWSDAPDDGIDWIFSVPIDGSSIPTLLFDPMPSVPGSAPEVAISPDAQWVVVRTLSLTAPSVVESAPVDGSLPAISLSGPGGSADSLFRITPSGTVLFTFTPTGGPRGLYRAEVDGSTSPVRIVGAPGDPIPVKGAVTSQGQVVFVGYTGQYELFRVPLDGSSAPVRLNPPLVAGGGLYHGNVLDDTSFALSPDEQWVVYLADQLVDERFELFALATDGSLPCRKLNATLAPGGDVFPVPAFAGTSHRVLYLADQEVDQTFELFTTVIQPGGGDGPCPRGSTGTPPGPTGPVEVP